jgi:hypothetical protein
MKGEDADAAMESVLASDADVTAVDGGTFWLLEGDSEIVLDVVDIGERLGRAMTVHELLVSFTSYVGRAEVSDTTVRVTSSLLQLEPEDDPISNATD